MEKTSPKRHCLCVMYARTTGLCDQLTADDPLMGAHMLGPSAQLGPPAMQVPAGTPTDMGMAMMPLSCSFDGAGPTEGT